MKAIRGLFAATLCGALFAAPAGAVVLLDFQLVGGDIVGTLSGRLDLTGASGAGPGEPGLGNTSSGIEANAALVGMSGTADPSVGAWLDLWNTTSAPRFFGPGLTVFATGASGSAFFVDGRDGRIGVREGYRSGTRLSGTISFHGWSPLTFADLGIIEGTYLFKLPSDTVVVRFGNVSPVPLPATGTLLLGGLAGLAGLGRRRKRRATAS